MIHMRICITQFTPQIVCTFLILKSVLLIQQSLFLLFLYSVVLCYRLMNANLVFAYFINYNITVFCIQKEFE